jgi:uncharacterized radical SAM superfamily protein
LLDDIISVGGRLAVHLTAGFGATDLMRSAELVKSKGLDEIVLLALVPTKGTITEDVLIAEDAVVEDVKALIAMGFKITLGCMRPRAHRDLETKCIEAGVRNIANPSRTTLAWAESRGMKVIERKTCCCVTQ